MLQVKDLAYCYKGALKASLSGVDLSVARGQILGLLGPNGAGKTTLISHISGLLAVQKGSITIEGDSLKAARRKDPTRIAIAPQEYAFYPILTVQENLNCFAAVSGIARRARQQRVNECIALTQLASHKNIRAEHLSGGLKRRLNLAIALLPKPDYLLLDEPTVGVDPQSRAFLIETVRGLAQQNVGIIYTTHYMEEVEALADNVVIIDHGRVLAQGTLSELLQRDEAVVAQPKVEAVGRNLEQLFMSLTHRTLRD
ncbi:MAG: ABC transporter ATP-binding protein [Formosimonas sp.]